MQKLTLLSMLAVTIFMVTACGSSTPKEVVIENRFKVMIPGHLSKTTTLNGDAILQYQHIFKEIYIIIIDDEKETLHQSLIVNDLTEKYPLSFDGFFNLLSNEDSDAFITIEDRNKVKDEKINGLQAKIFSNTRTINNTNVYYTTALVEGKDHYYQIIAWTTAKNESKNKKALSDMVYSFSEL